MRSRTTTAAKISAVLASVVFASAISTSPALAENTPETTVVSETEILVTYDNEVLEVGENGDVESVDAYLA